MKPILMALCAGWFAIGLGGCETATSLYSSTFGSSSDTPTASVASPPPAAVSTQPAQLAIAPVIGPPESVSQQLTEKLIADIERQNIRVAKSPNETAEYTLRGYVVSSVETKDQTAKISYIWDVTDASGKGVHRVSGEETAKAGKGADPWASVSPAVIEEISNKTVTSIASWLPTQGTANIDARPGLVQTAAATQPPPPAQPASISGPAASAPPATPAAVTGSIGGIGALRARVPSVTGAPGDGSSSLRSALQRELARAGVALAEAPSPQTYTVEGRVALGPGNDGKQPITIDWSVTDPTGKKLGTVSQKNEVPQGSLDGPWGKTADAAAAAAAQGILKLLPQTTKTSSN
jgi:uncharacterized lipoprotein YmbA